MNKKHTGLDLAGIIIIYIASCSYIVYSIGYFWSTYFTEWYVLLCLLGIVTLIITILYHLNKITNYLIVGILGIFVSLIGGIFILVAMSENEKEETIEKNDLTNLEYKLRQLDTLLTKGVLTKEEYDLKRKSIIESC